MSLLKSISSVLELKLLFLFENSSHAHSFPSHNMSQVCQIFSIHLMVYMVHTHMYTHTDIYILYIYKRNDRRCNSVYLHEPSNGNWSVTFWTIYFSRPHPFICRFLTLNFTRFMTHITLRSQIFS